MDWNQGNSVAKRHLLQYADQHLDGGGWNPKRLFIPGTDDADAQRRRGSSARRKQAACIFCEMRVCFGRKGWGQKSLRHLITSDLSSHIIEANAPNRNIRKSLRLAILLWPPRSSG